MGIGEAARGPAEALRRLPSAPKGGGCPCGVPSRPAASGVCAVIPAARRTRRQLVIASRTLMCYHKGMPGSVPADEHSQSRTLTQQVVAARQAQVWQQRRLERLAQAVRCGTDAAAHCIDMKAQCEVKATRRRLSQAQQALNRSDRQMHLTWSLLAGSRHECGRR